MSDELGPPPPPRPVYTWQPPPAPPGEAEPADPTAAPGPAPQAASGWPAAQPERWPASPWAASPWDTPSWGAAPPPEMPPPQRHRGRAVAIGGLLFLGAAIGSGVAVGVARHQLSGATVSRLVPGSSASPASSGSASLAPLPTAPSGSSSGQGGNLDVTTIANRVDPAIVDINVSVGDQATAAGTGMILTSSGEVLTNNHVVEGATSISVQVNGSGPHYDASVVGVDPTDDVALLQLKGAPSLPTVPLGNDSAVRVGDPIVALGNALGRGGTPAVSSGVVTALDQTVTASDAGGANQETLTGMIQVQAGIQPGDSGGPMVDSSGRVIAMTTAGSARVRRSGTIGFGIPITKALDVARQIQSGSGANVLPGHRGILGVEVDASITNAGGAAVVQVQAQSPAAAAGIATGAVIVGIDGTTVGSADALSSALRAHKPGDSVTVRWRDQGGQEHSAHITLAAGPPA